MIGGRSEVVELPAAEGLNYLLLEMERLEREAERRQYEVWLNFLSYTFAQQPMGEESYRAKQARQKFVDSIQPKQKKIARAPRKNYGWDPEVEKEMELLGERQEGG